MPEISTSINYKQNSKEITHYWQHVQKRWHLIKLETVSIAKLLQKRQDSHLCLSLISVKLGIWAHDSENVVCSLWQIPWWLVHLSPCGAQNCKFHQTLNFGRLPYSADQSQIWHARENWWWTLPCQIFPWSAKTGPCGVKITNMTNFWILGDSSTHTPSSIRAIFGKWEYTHGLQFHNKFYLVQFIVSPLRDEKLQFGCIIQLQHSVVMPPSSADNITRACTTTNFPQSNDIKNCFCIQIPEWQNHYKHKL